MKIRTIESRSPSSRDTTKWRKVSVCNFGHEDFRAVLFIVFVMIGASIWLGGDGSPDFRIYHLYNGYAALTGGRPQDIAAAQMQTYFFPGMDLFYYWLTDTLNHAPQVLFSVLSIPYGIAGICIYNLCNTALPADWPARRSLAVTVSLFGLTGSASLPTLGTSMSDIVPGSFVLFALCVYLRLQGEGNFNVAAVATGTLCGIAVGLKLTEAPYFLGFMIAMCLYERAIGAKPFRSFLVFGFAGGLAALLICGVWWWRNYEIFGNPLFPAFNDIFKSDFVAWGRWSDDRFKPRGIAMALFYPFYWAFTPSQLAIELNTRDARMALMYVGVVVLAVLATKSRFRNLLTRQNQFFFIFIPLFAVISFVFWERLLSIYRYLAVIEAISGLVILLAILPAARFLSRWGVNAVAAVVMMVVALTTEYPWWSRSVPAPVAVQVKGLPKIAPQAMVVFLDAYAMSYLVPSMPSDTRFVGANNNIVHLDDKGRLQKNVESAIRDHRGELWGLEYPPAFAGMAEATLLYYGLKRATPCNEIRSNIEEGTILMCRLTSVTSESAYRRNFHAAQ